MAVTSAAAASGTNTNTTVDRNKVGFGGLTSNDFMKMLIAQLQNQDPTAPVSNEELLNQLTTMRNLQSNIELGDAMKEITSNQQLTTAAGFIGKSIKGKRTDSGATVEGVVDKVYTKEGKAYLTVGSSEIPLSDVSEVTKA